MMNQCYEKWHSLSKSEQRTLHIGGFVLIGILYYSIILAPLLKDKKRLENRVTVEQQLYLDTKKRVENIYSSGSIRKQGIISDMNKLIQKISAQYKLAPIAKKQGSSWKIKFTDVSFTNLMQWLSNIENSGVKIEQFAIKKDNNKENYVHTANITIK